MKKNNQVINETVTSVSVKIADFLRRTVQPSFVSEKAEKLLNSFKLSGVIESAVIDAVKFKYLNSIDLSYYMEIAHNESFDEEICDKLMLAMYQKLFTSVVTYYPELVEIIDAHFTSKTVFESYEKGEI